MVYQGFQHAANPTSSAFIALMLAAAAIPLAATPALAQEPRDSAATPRQVAHCMMKRLRADRGESYRDAFKVCKQQLAAEPDRNADTAMNSSDGAVVPTKQD
jgi:hypothetical protein